MGETISDWIITMERAGLVSLARALDSDKLKDYKRLKHSGLPVFDGIVVPFRQFQTGNIELEEFLSKYECFVIRLIPDTRELPRRYRIGVQTFEECQEFLVKNVQRQYAGGTLSS